MGLEIKAADNSATIWLYGEIGESFFGDGISAKEFKDELADVHASEITLRVNSPGGDVFDANAIKALLDQHPATITTKIDGIAASAASFIAMAGDTIEMAEGSMMMIHNPWTVALGDATELRASADLLDKITGTLAEAYAKRSGIGLATVKAAMDNETWYTAEEAVSAGLASSVAETPAVAASVDKRWGYRNAPKQLSTKPTAVDRAAAMRRRLDLTKLKIADTI